MLISCILPTYNRYPSLGFLLEEAVESFLRQDHEDRELVICNDCPGQYLVFNHPQVRVLNLLTRFPSLGQKLQYIIEQCQGDYLCRWDDDDISLPHRLSLSAARIRGRLEWHPQNYWYMPGDILYHDMSHGNTHISAIFTREVVELMNGYPDGFGDEDQKFNNNLARLQLLDNRCFLEPEEMFYLYRWGTGSQHLSGTGHLEKAYNQIGKQPVTEGTIQIRPHWRRDYVAMTSARCRGLAATTPRK